MSIDYIVTSLPVLIFGEVAPLSWEKFSEIAGEHLDGFDTGEWADLETQLRNAIAEARGGEKYRRPAEGCALYWKNRILECFQEKDILRRDEAIDRVFWDAAGELTPPADPLGKGALKTYAIRLRIAIKRSAIDKASGNDAFDRLTAETKLEEKDL